MAFLGRLAKTFFPRFSSTVAENKIYDSVFDLCTTRPIGRQASIKGWVKQIRRLKKYIFINVNDGSCSESVQIVLSKSLYSKEVSIGSSVIAFGKVSTDHRGNIELSGESLDVIGECTISDGFPFTPGQKHSLEYCRQYLHHRPKLQFFSSLLRTRHSVTMAVHNYFCDNNFVGVHTPLLTSNDCEGAGETFKVIPSSEILLQQLKTGEKHVDEIFFDNKAFLTVSGQFHLEAITRSLPRVYTFNPTFRAENSKSRVHLSEFYMVEAEEAFITGIQDILHTIEKLVKSLISNVMTNCGNDINCMLEYNEIEPRSHMKMLETVLEKPFTVMTYSEAKDILNKHGDSIKWEKSRDAGFTKEEELFLVKHNANVPLFIINWPKSLKPFYMRGRKEENDEVEAVDLLVPVVGELCGGSVREDDYEVLHSKLEELKLVEPLNWYLELRKFGNVPTGGFGMGFERFLQFSLNISNIKDTIPFPRFPHNIQL